MSEINVNFQNFIHNKLTLCRNPLTIEYLKERQENGVDEANCEYFIKRKGRRCSHRTAPMSLFCSEHSPSALQKSWEVNISKRKDYENRMKSLIHSLPDQTIRKECSEHLNYMIDKLEGKDEMLIKSDVCDNSKKRIRNKRVSAPKRMANPFSESLSLLEEIEEMKYKIPEIYSDNSRPIHIDIGCAKGGCIESLSVW